MLLTNDDGIDAPGLAVLEAVAAELAHEVWVVAPEHDQSGTSHSISLHSPLRVSRRGERRFGAFYRTVVLPFEPAADAVAAHYDKGVLHLTVQKPAAKVTAAKTIPVQTGAPKAEEPPKVQ